MHELTCSRIEKRNKLYASLTQLIREKSFTFVLILRFSAVPGHIVTAVSASAGANLLSYSAAAFLTLPKQLVLVYLGTAFGTHNQKDVIISWCATVATFLATIVAAIYIYYHMRMIIKRGGASRLPVGDIDAETGGDWASVEVHGAAGVGAGVRLEMEEAGGGRRSIDVILGPHAAAQRQLQLANSPLRASNRPRALTRTRSLPGPITEDEMRTWLTQIDTALMTTTGAAGPAMDEKPRFSGDEDAFLGATSRAENGELDPIPYSQTMLLAPPAFTVLPPDTPPVTMVPLLPDLAHEHIYPLPASARDSLALPPSTDAGAAAGTRPTSAAGSVAASPPVSGTVPVILLTQTYTPARSRADSLRGTVSLDIERPRFENELDDVGELGQLGPRASAAARGRTRGESSAALLGRPRL